ncbi:autophagy-related protein 13 isoform X3 [Bombina bombina]|uniref:autophagy-related protein 13 isoform X3 n=1 Tax=Bombina bombina TaxID=8345 RepID=UPI00235AB5C9|nr:autophagy-related protein 13 isoform X3 [Bombina bombina]
MDTDLSPQDRKDLDKFVKFFALKAVQVIVQARLGDKICTRSSSSPTGSDWFNLAIKDIPEVTQEAKKALSGQLPAVGRSMCVEISLKTSEGDSMELEVWCLEMNEKCDREIKVSYTVYNRLSLLLKSLLAVTRVTPAYRLSRKQGHEYVILYRIYFGDVQLLGLKEGFQAVRVGTVATPIGTLTLTCAYRTNLAFMSTRASEDQGLTYPAVEDSQEICATSFSTSPPSQCVFTLSKAQCQTAIPVVTASHRVLMMGLASHQLCSSRLSYQPIAFGTGSSEMGYPVALAAGVSASHPHQMMMPGKEGGLPTISAQPAHGTQAEHERALPASPYNVAGTTSSSEDADTPSGSSTAARSSSPNKSPHVLFTRKVGAFVDKPSPQVTYASTDIPFAVFAPQLVDNEDTDPMVVFPETPEEVSPVAGSLQSSCSSTEIPQDDFVIVDFRPAFSKDDLPMDVGTFYREFQNPPQLSSLSIDIAVQSMAEDLDSLPEKLAIHEKNMEEFDAFVDSLQ